MIHQRAEFIDRDERNDVEVVDTRIVVGDGGEVVGGWMVEQSYLGHTSRTCVASSSIRPEVGPSLLAMSDLPSLVSESIS